MAKLMLFVIIIFLHSLAAYAQDERTFRELLIPKDKSSDLKGKIHFKARSDNYFFDINDDLTQENLYFGNLDGQTYFFIEDHRRNIVFKQKLEGVGPGQWPYKLSLRWLSPKSKAILIHYFEGRVDYLQSRGTSRLDVVTIDDRDLKKINFFKGPIIWDEQDDKKQHYHQRPYEISVIDLDGDGIRDISIKYHLISRVMLYRGNGKWALADRKF
ncbi:MAG: hypothetical protein Fur0010_09200 [Bdellovibrio sp.]